MKKSQMALIVDARKAANDDEFTTIAPVTRPNAAPKAPAASNGWDPFEVWRTRIKTESQFDPVER
jgi:hypothetical protein